MDDFWFTMYHLYSIKKSFSKKALKIFEKDVKFAQKIGVKGIVIEDYYKNWIWGEYTNFWCEETFKGMVNLVQDYGIKFIPYLDITELGTHGKVYKKYGKKWSAKNKWGKPYSGFSSIFLAAYYPVDWQTKLMCPSRASGWFDYLINQAHVLLTQYNVDGLYLDRLDYRTICYDHLKNQQHFIDSIPELVKNIRSEVKKINSKNLLIINDSCVNPDLPLIKCMKTADYVLTELLPVDTDPYNIYWKSLLNYGEIIWLFHRFLKPLVKIATDLSFLTKEMIDSNRIQYIINRIKKYVGNNIILFSHRRDFEGFKAIEKIVQKNHIKQGFFSGLKSLTSITNYFK